MIELLIFSDILERMPSTSSQILGPAYQSACNFESARSLVDYSKLRFPVYTNYIPMDETNLAECIFNNDFSQVGLQSGTKNLYGLTVEAGMLYDFQNNSTNLKTFRNLDPGCRRQCDHKFGQRL